MKSTIVVALPYIYIFFSISDIDECATDDNGGCAHFCLNNVGSFSCFCQPGYKSINDGQICHPTVIFEPSPQPPFNFQPTDEQRQALSEGNSSLSKSFVDFAPWLNVMGLCRFCHLFQVVSEQLFVL